MNFNLNDISQQPFSTSRSQSEPVTRLIVKAVKVLRVGLAVVAVMAKRAITVNQRCELVM